MWIRKWREPEEAWGATVFRDESELVSEVGEEIEIAAQQVYDNGELSKTYYATDEITDEEIEFDAPYQNGFIEWYENLEDFEVEELTIEEIEKNMSQATRIKR